ncbi:triple tyrosine motif-containing protein [uncultured Arcticibacterium sp.]|uniref:sensor histidine kinase n=1 Tax=uncultured Arcticibacterium sp. TaxID=2173042 RepID=UPI0030F6DF80
MKKDLLFPLIFLCLFSVFSCKKKTEFYGNTIKEKGTSHTSKADTNLYFKSYNTADGLISSELLNVYTDSFGYIWIATGKGVMRFDGTTFTPFFDDIDKNIRLQGATSFFEDYTGKLWLFSGAGYLHWYNRETNSMVAHATKLENGWSDERPMNMMQGAKEHIWVGGYGGIQKVSLKSDSTMVFPIEKIRNMDWPHPEKIRIEILEKDLDGQIWLGTRKFGLVKFDPKTGAYDFLRDRPAFKNKLLDDWITDIEIDKDGTFWISDFERGLVHFDPKTETILDFIEVENIINSPYKVAIREVLKEGNLIWLATNYHGLLLLDVENKEVVVAYNTENSELPANKIMTLNRDAQNNYWLSGSHLTAASSVFYKFKSTALGNNLPVYDLAATDNGIIGSTKKGIYAINGKGLISKKSSDNTAYFGLLQRNNKEIWAGSSFKNYVFSSDLKKTNQTYEYDQVVDSLGNYLRRGLRIMEDSQGKVWMIDNWNRLKFIEPKTGQIKNIFELAQDPISKKFIQVKCFLDDPENDRLLVGTDIGLATLSYDELKLNWINKSPQQSEFVSYLYRDKQNKLWGIFANKIFEIDNEDLSLKPLLIQDRDSEENFNWIVEEPINTYWMQSSLGIIKYEDGKSSLYKNSNFSEGSFNKPAPVVTYNGKVYFGGENGISVIEPELLKANQIAPFINLSSATVPFLKNDLAYDSTVSIGHRKGLELEYFQNRLSFEFEALHFKESSNNKIKYKLAGYDEEFKTLKHGNEAFYTNLNAGEYKLVFAAANSDGVWSEEKSFPIIIHPPWYKTWWAIILYVLLSVAAIYAWIRYRTYLNLQKFKATENIRTKISADLHDDVGSILTGLSMKSELMALGVKEIEPESLNKISEMAREAMERMRDTVWAIDSRKDKYENLLDRMNAYANTNLPLKNFQYDFDTAGFNSKAFIQPDVRQNLYLIFKEAITNLLKHSNGNKVTINLQQESKTVLMRIKDNGALKEDTPTDGLGQSNMRARAEKIGGNFRTYYDQGFIVEVALKQAS